MTATPGPPGLGPVAVVGALPTLEQAEEAEQMRMVLAWSLHLAKVRPQRGPSRSNPPR